MLYSSLIARCQHIKVNGTQCGSPAVRRNRYCFFHKRWREQHVTINPAKKPAKASLDLPVLEDANSIQVALMQVMRLLLAGQIEHKTASLLLYGLQTASLNLRSATFEPVRKETVVIDPANVDATLLGEDPWDRNDYESPDGIEIEACAENGALVGSEQVSPLRQIVRSANYLAPVEMTVPRWRDERWVGIG